MILRGQSIPDTLASDNNTSGAFFDWIGGCVAKNRHYDRARHEAWRAKVLKRAGYLCERCKRYGRVDKDGLPVRATIAHHKKHLDEHPELAFDVTNGEALCAKCHNVEHPEKGGARW